MTPLKNLQSKYPSQLSFARACDVHPYQLRRWLDNDAHVDSEGNVYIRTKGRLPVSGEQVLSVRLEKMEGGKCLKD